MKTNEDLETGKMGARWECSTPTDRRWYSRFRRSQRVKERGAPENVEARLVTGAGFLGHTLQYGQMRCFRSGTTRNELGARMDDPTLTS
jgi:hypothetical protein